MIQVDIFWAYGIGATFAIAAARQLKKEEKKWNNIYFLAMILFQAIFFVPAGTVLLQNFPNWESMQVFPTHGAIPLWLLVLWSVTNIANAALAYMVCWYFIKKDQTYMAFLQMGIGYFLFFWVLVYGWDGTGWQRFLYDPSLNGWTWDNYTVGLWDPSTTPVASIGHAIAWLRGNVFLTLLLLGVYFLPPMLLCCSYFAVQGAREDPDAPKKEIYDSKYKSHLYVYAMALFGIFGIGLGLVMASAAVSQLFNGVFNSISPTTGLIAPFTTWGLPNATFSLNAILGACIGIPIVIVPSIFLLFRKGMPVHWLYTKFYQDGI